MARKGSHQVDAILVPAAARAGREDEKLATVALNEVAVGIPLLANSRREDRVCIVRTTRVRNATPSTLMGDTMVASAQALWFSSLRLISTPTPRQLPAPVWKRGEKQPRLRQVPAAKTLVERFDIEPFSDFSAK